MPAHFAELKTLGQPHPACAWEQRHPGESVWEGPGPLPDGQSEFHVKKETKMEEVQRGFPCYCVGSAGHRIAPGYDQHHQRHRARWRAGNGRRMLLLYVTPKEHLGLPKRSKDVREGLIAYRGIAAHAPTCPPPPGPATARRTPARGSCYAFDWNKQFESLARSRTRPRIPTTKPCRPTSTKKPNSAQCAAPKQLPDMQTKITDEIWPVWNDVLKARSSQSSLRLCDVLEAGIHLLPIDSELVWVLGGSCLLIPARFTPLQVD